MLWLDEDGIATNADSSNPLSIKIARGIAERIKAEARGARLAGQMSGSKFEEICAAFLEATFIKLAHLRPGRWKIERVSKRAQLVLAKYQQYSHLIAIDKAARSDRELAVALGRDYIVTPDILIARETEEDSEINRSANLMDQTVVRLASLRKINGGLPILHSSISCKWTIRSDRAQNSRSEALNLINNRKGHLPHVVVITGEPLPSRIGSIALGTGNIDCVYHFALTELIETIDEIGAGDAKEMLNIMVEGKRLKDIADLPLDLAI